MGKKQDLGSKVEIDFEEWAERIKSKDPDRTKRVEEYLKARKVQLENHLEEFRTITQVWDARRFAEKHEPDPDWQEDNLFYVPKKGETWKVKKLLTEMYPDSKSDIREMNKKQAYRVYFNVMYFIAKTKRMLKNEQ